MMRSATCPPRGRGFRLPAAAFVLVAGLGGCAFTMPPAMALSSAPSALREAAAGCWTLDSAPGLFGRPLRPTRVRLDTAALADGGMRMVLLPPDTRGPIDLNHWGATRWD